MHLCCLFFISQQPFADFLEATLSSGFLAESMPVLLWFSLIACAAPMNWNPMSGLPAPPLLSAANANPPNPPKFPAPPLLVADAVPNPPNPPNVSLPAPLAENPPQPRHKDPASCGCASGQCHSEPLSPRFAGSAHTSLAQHGAPKMPTISRGALPFQKIRVFAMMTVHV